MERSWMITMREARYPSLLVASKAAKCSPKLLGIIEDGWVTSPGIAARIGEAYGMSRDQTKEITCAATAERRARESLKGSMEIKRDRLKEVYYG